MKNNIVPRQNTRLASFRICLQVSGKGDREGVYWRHAGVESSTIDQELGVSREALLTFVA